MEPTAVTHIGGAKLLQGVEKSYDSGKKLLDESVKTTESGGETRYSVRGGVAPTFYSNAERAVERVKQEKAKGEQWLAMGDEQRGASLAEDTEDVPLDEQEVRVGRGGVSMMGSRVNKWMEDVGEKLKGVEMTPTQRSIVEVYSGKSDRLSIKVARGDGERTITMIQGSEKAGAKHSLFKHYGTTVGVITRGYSPYSRSSGERRYN